ncbi:MAG: response regulator [Bacteroidota bacterium]|nr:response regulator [Kiloniellaceae bacterium]
MERLTERAAAPRHDALAGKVIVVLEDDDLVRRATERVLRRFGAEVVAGRSSVEVLAALAGRDLAVSCVVADFWLSREESGLAAVASLRAAAGARLSGARPGAVIVTGDLSRETAEAVAGAGFPLLRKPVDIDRFVAALLDG